MAAAASGQISTVVSGFGECAAGYNSKSGPRLTGSARTYLPEPVIRAIRTSWFRLPPADAFEPDLVIGNTKAFEDCDIMFSFKGDGTDVVDFRCNALYFLASPWRTPFGYVAPFAPMSTPPKNVPPTATLGLVS